MATFQSAFKSLPKSADLRALFYKGTDEHQVFPFEKEGVIASDFEMQYLKAVRRCVDKGYAKASRPGQYTLMLDDVQFVIDISKDHIPLLSSRYIAFKSFLVETLWFISGNTNVAFLKENGVSIWDEWVIPETAVFEDAVEYKSNEMLNWVRCKVGAAAYASWRVFQRDNNITTASVEEVETWWAQSEEHYTGKPIPKVALKSGSIGDGAYGAQWRRRVDTHLEYSMRTLSGEVSRDAGAEYTNKFPNYKVVGNFNTEINRGGATAIENVTVLQAVYDQLGDAVKALRNGADSRRILLDAWDPAKVKDCALPPCHPWVQFTSHVNEDTGQRELTVLLTMRSSDCVLGTPFNVGQYALLGHIIAHLTGHKATKLVFHSGDFHIYEDQLPFLKEQFERPVRPTGGYACVSPEVKELDDVVLGSVIIDGYQRSSAGSPIKFPIAV